MKKENGVIIMRNDLIDRFLNVHDNYFSQLIQIEQGEDYGECNYKENKIIIRGQGLTYYQIAFHEITHYIEYHLFNEIYEMRLEYLNKLNQIFKDKGLHYGLLSKCFHRSETMMVFKAMMEELNTEFPQPKELYQHPDNLPEFFPTLIERIYIKYDYQILRNYIGNKTLGLIYDYFNFLLDKFCEVCYNI